MRRVLPVLLLLLLTTLTVRTQPRKTTTGAPAFTLVEASIPQMQAAMKAGRLTSRRLVELSLIRIATYEDKLNAVITINPDALKEAGERDRERARGHVRGPLHGIPIALKDNIHTTNMPTTGGALAFDGFVPPYEATITKNLREAGAIIIAKTGMTELANWVAGAPTPMPGNYNALAGYGMNPYDPRRDPREATFDGRPALATGGSSSGIGTAASFWAANVGTETSGSILSPANANMLAAVKPTVGRVSRYGVIPITADQDTAGPMARTVTDAAILLGALEGASPDPNDPATGTCPPPPGHDYTRLLRRDGLKGSRIGIPRAFFYDETTPPGASRPRGGLNSDQSKAMADAIAVLKQQGAVIVDPADIPSVVDKNPISDEMDLEKDRARYEADRKKDIALAATHGIDEVMQANRLDALLFPGAGGSALAARPGYPTVIVPFALVPNAPTPPFPDGFNAKPGPFGVSFTGMACSEPRLLGIAYAFEQATRRRKPPIQ